MNGWTALAKAPFIHDPTVQRCMTACLFPSYISCLLVPFPLSCKVPSLFQVSHSRIRSVTKPLLGMIYLFTWLCFYGLSVLGVGMAHLQGVTPSSSLSQDTHLTISTLEGNFCPDKELGSYSVDNVDT